MMETQFSKSGKIVYAIENGYVIDQKPLDTPYNLHCLYAEKIKFGVEGPSMPSMYEEDDDPTAPGIMSSSIFND